MPLQALEHDVRGIGAGSWKHWSTTLQAIEHDAANEGIWLSGTNVIAFARGTSLFMRSGEDFFVKNLEISEKRSTFAGKYTRERHLLNHFIN